MSEKTIIGVVVTLAIVILIAVAGGAFYVKATRDEARRQDRAALASDCNTSAICNGGRL